ncbi:hypothetical protein [Notoacmeibacter sp. MSK16QG-6]|uniref:endonuclease toxin domain-containing protein n=1 Tax=Notoacmeibacter sp. MSK16QG-6 TaxID=2957982 RepID=UPI0020A0987E|nr:hypothetical protein [Notoacmeibacter sp. MSK16QG-6]MCP1200872.1 hypothetical protein [Notoacmeibacter sp. MSK16QG-6]
MPDVGPEFDAALRDAENLGAYRAVRDFAADFLPSVEELIALAGVAGDFAYLVIKSQTLGLTDEETARLDELAGAVRNAIENVGNLIENSPELLVAFRDHVAAVKERAERLEGAHRKGFATQADATVARERRGYLEAAIFLHLLTSIRLRAPDLQRLLRRGGSSPNFDGEDGFGGFVAALKRASRRLRNRSLDHDFKVVKNSGVIFGPPIQQQGLSFEKYLANAADLGDWLYEQKKNFKIFDFYDRTTRVATSVKTMNLSRRTLQENPDRVFKYLKRDLDKIRGFTFDTIGEEIVSGNRIKKRRLELAIPSDFSQLQLRQVNRARAYAESWGIEMNVTVVK